MLWLNHPSYQPYRDSLVEKLRVRKFVFKKLRKIVFLCGGAISERRSQLILFLQRHRPDVVVFKAEDVWLQIAKKTNLNALEMEDQLAQLADLVAVIVESPGTFAELGAFSLSPKLRKKLLPILDVKYRDHRDSFINSGPISWTDRDSLFSPTIYVDFETVLEATAEFGERLGRVTTKGKQTVEDLLSSPKHLLFLVCDLVSIIGPAPVDVVFYYVVQLLGNAPEWDLAGMLNLGVEIGVLKKFFWKDRELFYRPVIDGRMKSFTYESNHLNYSSERAKHLSVVQRIPFGREVLNTMRQD